MLRSHATTTPRHTVTDDFFTIARAELERLQAEELALERSIVEARRRCQEISDRREQIANALSVYNELLSCNRNSMRVMLPPEHDPEETRYVAILYQILSRVGQMRTPDLAIAIIDRGFRRGDPEKVRASIFTTMSRRPDLFKNLGSGVWEARPGGTVN